MVAVVRVRCAVTVLSLNALRLQCNRIEADHSKNLLIRHRRGKIVLAWSLFAAANRRDQNREQNQRARHDA